MRDIDILAVGSFIALKRFDLLVELVARLAPAFPGLRVVLCGKGPEEHRLRHLATQHGLDKHIQWMGEVPYEEVLATMQRARLLVHPSSYEGFGQVLLEALYAGCQVISFVNANHVTTPRWHVVGTPEEMATRCEWLLRQPDVPERVRLYTIRETANAIDRLF